MDHTVGLAILAEGGVLQHGGRQLHPARESARLMQQRREGVTIVSNNSAFGFFRRIFSRVAEYITRIRRYFIFTLAKDGKLVVKEEKRATTGNEIKVEATTSGACEPLLTEIVVSLTEAVTEPTTAELRNDKAACGSNCLVDEPTLRFENHGDAACQIESASNNLLVKSASNNLLVKSASNDLLGSGSNEVLEGVSNDSLESAQSPGKSDSHMQEPGAHPSTTCELPDLIIPLELNRHSQEREPEEEFPMRTKDAPSCDVKLETPVGDKKTRMSISQLNAIMVEQVRKYLQALERSIMITPFAEAASMPERKATHWRAILLATLVAVAVWARNARHLHQSMPTIQGSSINVHIRSRL